MLGTHSASLEAPQHPRCFSEAGAGIKAAGGRSEGGEDAVRHHVELIHRLAPATVPT